MDYRAILDRISYKENWKLEMRKSARDSERMELVLYYNGPDAYKGYQTSIHAEFWIWANTEEGVILQILQSIMQFELHEVMEFFKVDGKSIYSPDHNNAPWKIPEGIKLH